MTKKQGFIMPIVLAIIAVALIGGGAYYFIKQKQSTTPVLPEQTTPTSAETQSSVPSDWKTYRNEQYGFEFKYPPTFVVETTKYRYLSLLRESGIFHILIYDPSKEPSFRHCGANDCTNIPFEYSGISVDVFPKDGLKKVESLAQEKNCGTSDVTIGNATVTLYCQGTLIGSYGFTTYKTERFDYYFEPDYFLSEKILSTFNFFSPTPDFVAQIPSDWKTYRSEKYGFEFKYPSIFKVVSESFVTYPKYNPMRDQFAGTAYVQLKGVADECVPHKVGAQKGCWDLTVSIEENPLNATGLIKSSTLLGGISAEQIEDYGASWNAISIQTKIGYVWYILSLSSGDPTERQDTETLIKKIGASFKFTK
jgi:hypothetical protein